jgi:methionine aminotransferase
LINRSFLISSFGKTFHTTGWKIAYAAGPENLMNEFRKVHQYLVFSCNSPVQLAIADYMKDENNYKHLHQFYQNKRDYFGKLIKNSRFEIEPCAGTYFQLLNYSKISEEKDVEIAKRLTQDKKIASVPLSVFYHEKIDNKLLRFCFAKKEETLEKAAELICSI